MWYKDVGLNGSCQRRWRSDLIPVRNDTACLVLRTHLTGKEVSTDCVSQAGPKEVHTGQIEGDEIQ